VSENRLNLAHVLGGEPASTLIKGRLLPQHALEFVAAVDLLPPPVPFNRAVGRPDGPRDSLSKPLSFL